MPGRCGTPLSTVTMQRSGLSSGVPTLPLRADVLLSNTLFEELDNGFSEEFLRHYLGHDGLENADSLEIQVDTVGGSQRVESIGELLPNLRHLRLNESVVCSVRDLGTSLQNLRVLWLCRSSLQEIEGICAMPLLEELYVAFNDIRDLSPLSSHESLKVIDLEGNLVEDFGEVESLGGITTLREMNLSLNPLWRSGELCREDVFKALPQLEVLDDIPRDNVGKLSAPLESTEDEDANEDEDDEEAGMVKLSDIDEPPLVAPSLLRSRSSLGAEMLESKAIRELRERSKASAAPGDAYSQDAVAARVESNQMREAWSKEGVAPGEISSVDEKSRRVARDLAVASDVRATLGASSYEGKPPLAEGHSAAVAELHASVAKLRATPLASRSPNMGCLEAEGISSSGTDARNSNNEPTEQDLVVEGVKRAKKPTAHFWKSASARPACHRPALGFFPDRRGLRSAWSSGGSSASTMYRPATASSELNTSRSTASGPGLVDGECASSDLTTGDDGSALVGNPLSACRRRRRIERSQGEDELNIRNLLRLHHSGGNMEGTPWSSVPGEKCDAPLTAPRRGVAEDPAAAMRPGTPDVRIRVLPQTPSGCSSLQQPPRRVHRSPTAETPKKAGGGYEGSGTNLGASFYKIGGAEVLELS
eukprot:TRINITY_DN26146_c0_g1_i1.p1 TRINITY_DN26146_c0_g1~~TRINITY_DN26146_c0_g1_i1.p1  ORF type:complete len:649 (+),score=103.74 TRINITY_DN26146_c0_g1_i1:138-2084(+)